MSKEKETKVPEIDEKCRYGALWNEKINEWLPKKSLDDNDTSL
jgi:hypothetical protein